MDDPLTTSSVQRACSPGGSPLLSTVMFQTAITNIYLSNAAMDVALALEERVHFDDEEFEGGRDVITAGTGAGSRRARGVSE